MSDRFALIIANSEFDDPKLSRLVTPSRDAEALAKVLSDPNIGGFKVTLLVDETEPVVRREVAYLYHPRKRGDLLLLYYSGHGIRDERSGALYLATRDTQMDIASATALEAAFVRGQIDMSNSQRKVVILDCCHSGAFAGGGAKAALGSSVGTQETLAGSGFGRVILTASNAVEYAWEGDRLLGEAEKTSVFTHFLVEGLQTGAADRNGDGRISLDELYDHVYEQVITSGRSKQTPQKWAQKVEGEIIIARNPHPVVKPAELPLELRQAIESPFAGVRLGAVSELEHLLYGSDRGLALAAHEALTRLVDDDSRRVSDAAARALGISPPPVKIEKPPEPEPKPELHPSLALKLSVEPQTVDAGDKTTWTVTLHNDGDDDLRQVSVRRGRTQLDAPFDLAAGKERRFTFTTTYKTEGQKTEKVTAMGVASTGESVRHEARATVQVIPTSLKEEPAIWRRLPIWGWGAIALVAALVIGGAIFLAIPDGKPPPTPTDTPEPTPTDTPIPFAPPGMVHVRASEFTMGSTDAEVDSALALCYEYYSDCERSWFEHEQPVHTVYLDAFYIDETEVTNAEYRKCVEAGACRAPTTCDWGEQTYGDASKADHPVVCVGWNDADAYCRWAGKRLPTEAEWEKAARGTDGRTYPWGEGIDCDHAQYSECGGGTMPVGSKPKGASPYAALDMAGNVWEWVADWYDPEYYSRSPDRNPPGPESGEHRVLRGGSWHDVSYDVRGANRDRHPPDDRYYDVGFRCARGSQ